MGINNVLSAHTVGAGAGQDPADYTNQQTSGSLPSPQPNTEQQQAQPVIQLDEAAIRRFTLYGVIAADILLIIIVVALVM